MMAFASQLMKAGCRYAVCAGSECEDWHDAFDYAFVRDHLDEPEEKQEAERKSLGAPPKELR